MTRDAGTRGRNRVQVAAEVSLFPFLAVLICTMGTLIVVLVVITHHARVQAAQAAAAKAVTADEDLKTARELCQWRAAELKASREKTLGQLAEARLQLGHLEDHARRLREELSRLEASWAELERLRSGKRERQDALAGELARLRVAVAEAEKQLADARRDAQERSRSYAIIPYQGPNETRRRPIYIECRAESVILQPEGIILSPADFDEPVEPGNPLDAALRATREYLLSSGQLDAKNSGEPYPLLLVRPNGTVAYAAARAAIQSWGSEFGYELIGEDWRLEFPPPDFRLAEIMAQAVDTARLRRERLAEAAPRRYGRSSRPVYRAAPTRGGIIRMDESGDEDEEDWGEDTPPAGPRFGDGSGGTGSGFGTGSYGGGAGGTTGSGTASGTGTATGVSSNPGHLPSGAGGATGGDAAYQSLGSNGQASDVGTAGLAAPSGGTQESDRTYRLLAEEKNTSGTGGNSRGTGNPLRGPGMSGPPREATSQPGEHGSPVRPGEWMPGQSHKGPTGETASAGPEGHASSLAKTRGKDWGLPGKARDSVPVTRPIRVECYGDRLVIVPEQGLGQVKVIPLGPRTEQSIDRFVSAVWEHMDSWGIAGRSMYWHPILNVYTAPGAESRAGDLEALLEGSGLEVRRR